MERDRQINILNRQFGKAIDDKDIRKMSRLIIDPRVDVNLISPKGDTALTSVLEYNLNKYPSAFSLFKKLIDHSDIDVNRQNRDQDTPLIIAIRGSSTNIIKMLLGKPNIDVNIENEDEKNALSILLEVYIDTGDNYLKEIVLMLINAGSTLKEEDFCDYVVMFYNDDNKEMVELLFRYYYDENNPCINENEDMKYIISVLRAYNRI